MKLFPQWYRPVMVHGPETPAQKILYHMLKPLAGLYGAILWMRALGYRYGLLDSEAFSVPVISVGNLAVGGTGKTPIVDLVARYCLARGKRVAVVSRGYGGHGAGEAGIVSDGRKILLDARISGDEPLLLARRNPGLIVVVAPRRAQGVRAAIERLGSDLIILDDGFQHLKVRRDLDIVLLDATRPFGNGQVLPAGLLREFPTALKRGHLFLLTRAGSTIVFPAGLPGSVLACRHRLADRAIALNGQTRLLETLRGQRVVAFAGISDPDSFFAELRAKGLEIIETLAFPDHVVYNRIELTRIAEAAGQADCLVTTEKDAVKLREEDFPVACYRIPLELVFEQPEMFYNYLDRLLAKESTMPIKQELLDILACPQCKGEIRLNDDRRTLVCDTCHLAYPIRDDIPVMLIDEAERMGDA